MTDVVGALARLTARNPLLLHGKEPRAGAGHVAGR